MSIRRPEAVVVATARSPIGRAHKGSLTEVRADDLAASIVHAAMAKVPELDSGRIEDLFMGAAHQTGEQSRHLGRRVAVLLGLDTLPSATVNRACASSLQTTQMAVHAIRAGEGDAFLSAGVECVSRLPQTSPADDNPLFGPAAARTAERARGATEWRDPRREGQLPDFYISMGLTAENVADMCGVSRADQDEFALRSQRRCAAARDRGFYEGQITPVRLAGGGWMTEDESPRPATTAEGLAALAPVFRPGGSVTAGNSCPLNDGAAALVVVRDDMAHDITSGSKVRVLGTATSGLSPEIMGLGPVEATHKVLARCGLSVRDLDLVELNEAFAAQAIACIRELGLDEERVNVNGGAISVGHPFGMTGARLIATAAQALEERDEQVALVTVCVGMGQGMAVLLERVA